MRKRLFGNLNPRNILAQRLTQIFVLVRRTSCFELLDDSCTCTVHLKLVCGLVGSNFLLQRAILSHFGRLEQGDRSFSRRESELEEQVQIRSMAKSSINIRSVDFHMGAIVTTSEHERYGRFMMRL